MYVFISALILLVCGLLILVVLVQNSKGGGLASNFQSSNQVMGVRRTADFLEKATWTLAITLVVLSVLSTKVVPRKSAAKEDTMLKEQLEQNESPIDPNAVPFPTDLPEE